MVNEQQVRITPETAETLQRVIGRFGKAYAEWAQGVARAMGPPLKKMHAAMWRVYREAGAPYGESEEGLMRWAREENRRRSRQEF